MKVYCDGTCGNGIEAAYAICEERNSFKRVLGTMPKDMTTTEIEYHAIIHALGLLKNHTEKHYIFTDSQQVADELNLLRHPSNIELFTQAKDLMNPNILVVWIPRNMNLAGQWLEKRNKKINNSMKSYKDKRLKRYRQRKRWTKK